MGLPQDVCQQDVTDMWGCADFVMCQIAKVKADETLEAVWSPIVFSLCKQKLQEAPLWIRTAGFKSKLVCM